MSCPLGFTEGDGPNPHKQQSQAPSMQPVQKDGRVAPPLPPRPHAVPWHDSRVKQGPVPAWASFISAWYNQMWGFCRAIILAFFLLFLAPFMHVACGVALRVPVSSPRVVRWACWLPARTVKWLFGGLVFFFFESMAGCIYMFSGTVEQAFWGTMDTDNIPTGEEDTMIVKIANKIGLGSRLRTASTVPNAGGTSQVAKAAKAAASSPSSAAASSSSPSGAPVAVFVSNQTSYESFLDSLVFFSLAYRRGELTGLWFMPLDTREWGWGSWGLYQIFLRPLTVSTAGEIDRILACNTPCSFVAFPEATAESDTVPLVSSSSSSSGEPSFEGSDLLHVRSPIVSKTLVRLLLRCTAGVSTASPNAPACPRPVSVVEATLAYSGSLQADIEQRALDALANTSDSGALDEEEEEEFERLTSKDWTEDGAAKIAGEEESNDGYSAETINVYAHGRITTRRPRKYNPNFEVFCTAAPLRPVHVSSPRSDLLDAAERMRASPTSAAGRAALARARVVPSFYAFLSGNAPTNVGVLLNQYDEEYVRSRILQLPGSGNNSAKSAASKPKPVQLSAAEEAAGASSPASTSASRLRDASEFVYAWLQHRFLHQEQQLSLFSVQSQFHTLPSSLSASSIPVCAPLESYAVPVSSIKASKFIAIVWTFIVLATLGAKDLKVLILNRLA